jgi:hypothetical protein
VVEDEAAVVVVEDGLHAHEAVVVVEDEAAVVVVEDRPPPTRRLPRPPTRRRPRAHAAPVRDETSPTPSTALRVLRLAHASALPPSGPLPAAAETTTVRWLPLSATKTLPVPSTATPRGYFSWPAPMPTCPKVHTAFPTADHDAVVAVFRA